MILTHLAALIVGIATGWGITRLSASTLKHRDESAPIAASENSISENSSEKSSDQKPFATFVSQSMELETLSADALRDRLLQTELAYHMAAEMGQYKAGFLARTSHELRSPLNSIMSLHQLILNGLCDSPEEERDFIEQSYASAQKLLGLLNEASNVSKLEHGSMEMFLEPLSLTALLSELETLTHLHARNRNLRLSIEPPQTDVQVLGDRRWLRQVLMNLVTTSIHHMNEGNIRIFPKSLGDQGMVQLWLEDERSPEHWREAVDLLNGMEMTDIHPEDKAKKAEVIDAIETTPTPVANIPYMPIGLSLPLNQLLMEKMSGKLTVVHIPHDESSSKVESLPSMSTNGDRTSCIQCSIPLAVE